MLGCRGDFVRVSNNVERHGTVGDAFINRLHGMEVSVVAVYQIAYLNPLNRGRAVEGRDQSPLCETGHTLATLSTPRVKERRGGGLESASNDSVHQVICFLVVARRKVDGAHYNTVLEPFDNGLSVKVAEGVLLIELPRAHERLEPELVGVGTLKQCLELVEREGVDRLFLPEALLKEVVCLLSEGVEESSVCVDVLDVVCARRFVILVKLDVSVLVSEEKFGIQVLVCGFQS